MKKKVIFYLSCLALLLTPASLHAQAIKYLGGSGTILEGTKSADGEYAVVLSETGDNVVVNLREKNEVLRLTAEDDWQFPYFPGLNHGSLDVTWGPDQEGSRFGILIYGAKWETAKAFLIEVDPEFGSQTDILPILLKGAAEGAQASGTPDPASLAFSFGVVGVDAPEGIMVITDPLDIRIGYHGEIPKSDEETAAKGTFRLRLTRTANGPQALALKTKAPVAADGRMNTAAFKALRDRIDEEIEDANVKKVKVHNPSSVKNRKLSYMGHLEGNVLKRLIYVDSESDENESYAFYYWQDGQLVSALVVRKGTDTKLSGVGRTTEIYNFEDERLVSLTIDGEPLDPGTEGFSRLGSVVAETSIARAGVIYAKIGAD